MNTSIWVLFSVQNDYNQPENNLEAWWIDKPTIHNVVEILGAARDSDAYKTARLIVEGSDIRYAGVDYRLQQVEKGVIL